MTERISAGNFFPNKLQPIPSKQTSQHQANQAVDGDSFQTVLQQQFVRFSHHAEMRLQQRGIQLKPEQMQKLESAIQKAHDKGAKDSLILLQDMALIVNIKNRTVVTAMEGSSMKDNVFTQIDSTVIIS